MSTKSFVSDNSTRGYGGYKLEYTVEMVSRFDIHTLLLSKSETLESRPDCSLLQHEHPMMRAIRNAGAAYPLCLSSCVGP